MLVFYDRGQQIIWDTFFRYNNLNTLIVVLENAGVSFPDRYAQLMRAYWEDRDVSQKRPGHIYFPDMLYYLANKPDGVAFPPPGDFRESTAENYVLGGTILYSIIENNPDFTPISFSNYDPTDLYQGFSYMIGFMTGVSRFMAITDDIYTIYVASTDSAFDGSGSFKEFPYTGTGRT